MRFSDFLLALLFLFITAFVWYAHIVYLSPYYLLWFSNHISLFIVFGILLRSKFIFTSIFCLGFLYELFWVADFFSNVVFGFRLFGITDYLLVPGYPKFGFFAAFVHFLNPIALIYFLNKFGYHSRGYLGSIFHGAAIWLISLIFVPKELNLNCAFANCLPALPIPNWLWQIAWPFITIGIIFLQFLVLKKIFKHAKSATAHL